MKDMHKLKELLCRELEQYKNRDKLTMSDLEIVHKITDTIKNIDKIKMLEEEEGEDEGYSHRTHGGGDYGRRMNGRHYYDEGVSHNRGRSYDSGYDGGRSHSDGTDQMIGKLERMMDDADPKYREMFQRFIGQIQHS